MKYCCGPSIGIVEVKVRSVVIFVEVVVAKLSLSIRKECVGVNAMVGLGCGCSGTVRGRQCARISRKAIIAVLVLVLYSVGVVECALS